MSFLSDIAEQVRAWTVPEIVAVLAAIAYLLLAIRQNIWCWLFAIVSTAIYIGLFLQARLYMESGLNAFYLATAVYGWYRWSNGSDSGVEQVVAWPLRVHANAIAGIAVVAAFSGYVLQTYSDAVFPYIDSLTTWFAIWATFLVAHKVLENWWYWLVIDVASIYIYWSRDLQLTAILFVVYVIMIPFGFLSWRRSMKAPAT